MDTNFGVKLDESLKKNLMKLIWREKKECGKLLEITENSSAPAWFSWNTNKRYQR